jgi:protein tyrosine phosphatase (PTP) superfamily phosphohydrolase (DUF442 family)
LAEPETLTVPGVHNVWRITPTVYSGSSPEGAAGFAGLRALGVRTVVSVDGAEPDVALAEQHGLRYVHVPIGYDGVPRDRALQLAQVLRTLPGPVFVHCHHGKHRGPAAAMAACRLLDPRWDADRARRWLEQAGTDPHYRGLYADVAQTTPATTDEWQQVPTDFSSRVAGTGWVARMVHIDECWEQLLLIRSADWQTPADHPDLDPPHVALQLRELYRELARHPETAQHSADVRSLLQAAETTAGQLEHALRQHDRSAAQVAFTQTQHLCKQCHRTARDNR